MTHVNNKIIQVYEKTKNIILYLRGKYSAINLGGNSRDLVIIDCSVITTACGYCTNEIESVKYKNRLSAIFSVLILKKHHRTDVIGLCDRCLSDEELMASLFP